MYSCFGYVDDFRLFVGFVISRLVRWSSVPASTGSCRPNWSSLPIRKLHHLIFQKSCEGQKFSIYELGNLLLLSRIFSRTFVFVHVEKSTDTSWIISVYPTSRIISRWAKVAAFEMESLYISLNSWISQKGSKLRDGGVTIFPLLLDHITPNFFFPFFTNLYLLKCRKEL